MAISQTITDIPTPPSSSDATNFRTRADAFMASLDTLATELNTFGIQANALETNVNAKEASTVLASQAAVSSANFKGTWSSATAYVIGESVVYSGVIYRSLLNGTNQTPSSSPTYWVSVSVASGIANTPSGTISATDVQGAINELDSEKAPLSTVGSLGAQGAHSTSFTLTQAMAGKLQVLTAGGLTITLPAINSITSGSCFILRNGAATSSTIALNSNTGDIDRLTILPNETFCIQSDGASHYRLVYRSQNLPSIIGNSGYSYMPNGLLMQWGTYTGTIAAGGGTLNVTTPIAFPTNCLYSGVSVVLAGVNNQVITPFIVATTVSNILITNNDLDSTITQLRWFAIGY